MNENVKQRCMQTVKTAGDAIESLKPVTTQHPRVFGDDPCQGIRDALATEEAALAVLEAAVTLSQAVVSTLEQELMECENPT